MGAGRRRHVGTDRFSFGELPDPSASSDAWLIVVRGQLAGEPASAPAGHDSAIDVWNTDDLIETMYENPDVAAGFMALFAEPRTLQVFRSSAWHQW